MESTDEQIIPTRYRVKIPHLLSYPTGAEKISKALHEVPQFSQLILRFYFDSDWHIKEGRYEFIRIEYRNHSEQTEWTKLGLYKRLEQYRWEIVIQPVPRVLRSRVNGLVESDALPEIRNWLVSHGNLKRQGTDVLAFFFDEAADVMTIERLNKLEPTRR